MSGFQTCALPFSDGGRKRAGAYTAPLAAAVKQGVDGDAFANPQCADALGSVNLVGGGGDQGAGVERARDTPEALHGVAEQERPPAAGDGGDFGDGLDGADLVVDEHGGNEAGAGVDATGEEVEIDEAVRLHGRDIDLETLCSEPLDRIEHAGMFGGEGDDLAFFGGETRGRAL